MNIDAHTPVLAVIDSRGLPIRQITYYRMADDTIAKELVTHRLYDPAGRLIASRDPRLTQKPNLITIPSLSGQALLTDSVDAGWRLGLLGEAGQALMSWDGRGTHRQFEYDEMLRPVAVAEQAKVVERFMYGDASSFEHNQCNQLIRHDDPAGTRLFPDYGLPGSALSETRQFLQSLDPPDWPPSVPERDALLEDNRLTSVFLFNAVGEAIRQTDAMDNTQHFAHTPAGQIKSVGLTLADADQPQTLVSNICYNAFGQVESETAGNGVISTTLYRAEDGLLLELHASLAGQPPLRHLKYDYDPVGNILQIEDAAQPIRFFANQRIEPINHYRYDTLYQLIEATGQEVKTGASHGPALPNLQTPPDPSQLAHYTQTYNYDAAGNLLEMHHVGAQSFTRTMRVAPDCNRSLPEGDVDVDFAEAFDANGNLQQLIRGQTMNWDRRNQLRQITLVQRDEHPSDTETYIYDGNGQRCRKISSAQASGRTLINEVRYLPGLEIRSTADGEILHVISAQAGRSSVRVLHWQAGQPAGVANDPLRYSLDDHLGSSTLELDTQGGLISQESYYPFGGTAWWAARSAIEAKYKTIRYSGKERDASGLYYYGLRYYAPWLQRWINPDPAGDVDGLNRYRFVCNQPVILKDSEGTNHSHFLDAVSAYDRMFRKGLVWDGLMRSSENGLETMVRLSKANLSKLESEMDGEKQRNVADRIAAISPEDYWITHFSRQDFSNEEGAHFKSLVTLQHERGDPGYEGNSEGGNIPNYGNHDFAFFALETGGVEPLKSQSRFGNYRYHATLSTLGPHRPYTHIEVTDLLRHNTREISETRSKSLHWFNTTVGDPIDFLAFKHRVGLREDKEADLLFLGDDMLQGLGSKIAVDLGSLPESKQDVIVEWITGDRPLENVNQVINSFYRPQIAVPKGLKLNQGQFILKKL
jgi:insecticidal toxin complex protein TccC